MEKKVFWSIIGVALLWFIMFSPWTAPHINFWITMSISAVILWAISFMFGGDFKKQFTINYRSISIGIVSAIALWIIFYVGDFISSIIFDFSKNQVSNIYALRDGENHLIIGLMLALLIGPAEEIFWRGYIQGNIANKYGECKAIFSTAFIYALAHIWSFNFMLIMAALVCGLFWGALYKYSQNITTLIISHALWDVSVFLIFPIH